LRFLWNERPSSRILILQRRQNMARILMPPRVPIQTSAWPRRQGLDRGTNRLQLESVKTGRI
jgi:hypothetical protein